MNRTKSNHWQCICALVVLVGGIVASTAHAAVTGRFDVALIRVTYNDSPPAASLPADLVRAASEMHEYFAQLSFNKLNLQVQVVEVGLDVDLNDSLCPGVVLCNETVFDIIEAVASSGLSFGDIEGILIVNAGCNGIGGYAGNELTVDRPGVNGAFQISVDEECGGADNRSNVNWGPWAHEIGHQLQYVDGRDGTHPTGYASGYNLMDSCYPCGESALALVDESQSNETGAAGGNLVFPGWLPADRIHVSNPSPGTGETIVLSPITRPLERTVAPLGLKIRLWTGLYYFLELRRKTRADGWAGHKTGYDEGVQIIRVNEAFADRLGVVVDSCDTLDPAGCIRVADHPACSGGTDVSAATHPRCWPYPLWHSGDVYRDLVHDLTISIGSASGDGIAVTVSRGVAVNTPDLFSTPWLTPPMNTYETIDIWVDSSCNGYEDAGGLLRYGRRSDGSVIGNGDNPCINHPNRVYTRVRNVGDAPALNAEIEIQVADPLGVGISGEWRTLDVATVAKFPALASIAPGDDTVVYADWVPEIALTEAQLRSVGFGHHSCLRVRARPVAGERVVLNLDGHGEQENVSHFQVYAGPLPGIREYKRSIRLSNPRQDIGNEDKDFRFRVDAELPTGWRYQINGGVSNVLLLPRESKEIPIKLIADGPIDPGTSWHLKVAAYTIEKLTPPPYVSTKRIEYLAKTAGGVTLTAHGVEGSKIGISAVNDGVIRVKGQLDPPIANTLLTVDYLRSDGTTLSRLVRTGLSGQFEDKIQVKEADSKLTWQVRAIWPGTDKLAAAVSEVTKVRQ